VFSAAYFTKADCWSYEQERRLIVPELCVRSDDGVELLDVPKEAVSRIICGPNASESVQQQLQSQATDAGCPYLDMKVGRTTTVPHFLDAEGNTWLFVESEFSLAAAVCSECGEPLRGDDELCTLCSVDDAHRHEAARRNPYRMLDHNGMLSDYIRDMDNITAKFSKPGSR